MKYNPKCRLFTRKRRGKVEYWINYYLDNGTRVQRFLSTNRREANELLRFKEAKLLRSEFDAHDLKKMPEYQSGTKRLMIEEGTSLYLTTTANRKTPQTHIEDTRVVRSLFDQLWQKGMEKMEDITPLAAQQLFNELDNRGLSEATLKTYHQTMSKVFNFLIDEVEVLHSRNPFKKVVISKKGRGIAREQLLSDDELSALLFVTYGDYSGYRIPIGSLVRFILFTGCRVGEALPLEWSDIDMDNGVWRIQEKPQCPTKFKCGWSPKWHKSRTVILFPEAFEVLAPMPVHENTFGSVWQRDQNHKLIGHEWLPAEFVFVKSDKITLSDGSKKRCYTRIDDLRRPWWKLLENARLVDVQLKDLRTQFNHVLCSQMGLSHKEAGSYLGNSEQVNRVIIHR